ncbi:hypothetical protein G6O69_24530 [Pseudenhygromyxa sp. WMMC2535]|uniref:hypothetical protein n=1 Tax=Pseudenhygromyxa sp. WMMC2535 TaxID=2712867 RepID=UPI0015555B48|nr:hypothetical protein [Pseudenhygromyxa sp. WMMC2535]NVB41030.1 hypothetical protein [Pseudenhygromyxa sp. WMMC2535]
MPQTTPMALTGVSTEALEKLLRHLYRNEIEAPFTPVNLSLVGMQYATEMLMQSLRGLDQAGVRAVLVAVIAERRAQESRP